MPSKKKKGKGGNRAERQLALANRAERKLPIEALPPFPGPETYEQEMKRILGYKHLCIQGSDTPISLTREGSMFTIQEYSRDMQPERSVKFKVAQGCGIKIKVFPDYDRNAAAYPVARDVISTRGGVGMARRVKKRIDDVPADKLDVFRKFIEGGEGIEVVCGDASDIPMMEYSFAVKLVGEEYTGDNMQMCTFLTGKGGGLTMGWAGCFSNNTLERYQKDLALFLMYEIMVRISSGIAKIEGEVSSDDLVKAISKALCATCTERKKWKDMIGVSAYLLDRAIENKFSLDKTAGIERELGEALEACGFFSQAALLYAEAGSHFHLAEHPFTARMMHNAGIAWKRHGDYEKAESFYAVALHSLRFQYDHVEYREDVFRILSSLFLIYYDPDKNIAPLKLIISLRALILAAGEEVPVNFGFTDDGMPVLREAYQNANEEQICRVIQSIVTKSTSVKEMRAAIMSCGNPSARHRDMGTIPYQKDGNSDHARSFIEDSRGHLQDCYQSTGFIGTCSACGDMKEEKSFAVCAACKNEYYCDASCQTAHWPEHRRNCKGNRRKK